MGPALRIVELVQAGNKVLRLLGARTNRQGKETTRQKLRRVGIVGAGTGHVPHYQGISSSSFSLAASNAFGVVEASFNTSLSAGLLPFQLTSGATRATSFLSSYWPSLSLR